MTLNPNQSVTCTFTNTLDSANLTLAKSVSPAGETFNLQVTGFGAEELGDGASGTQRSVAANTEITFNEADGTGTLTDYTSSIECRDDGDNALVSLDTDNQTDGGVTLNPNQSVTCTFTNTLDSANLTLAKSVSPAGETFNLQVSGFGAEELGDGASGTQRSVAANTEITFNEADGTGTLTDYTSSIECRDDGDNALVSLDTDNQTDGGVTLNPNQSVTCTFTNTLDSANLTLAKSVSPAGETFNLQVSGFGAEELGDGASGTQRSVAANTEITFNEADGTGTLTDYTSSIECRDDGDNALVSLDTDNQTDGGVTLNPNQSVTCTFTNTLASGNLTLAKVLVPTEDISTFQLTVSGFGGEELGHNESGATRVVAANVPIAISEADGTGQNGGLLSEYLSTLACVDDDNAQTPVTVESNTGTGASVTLTANQNVTCTFTNEFQAIEPPSGDGIITCGLGAVTPLVRAEGIAELLGDILITCHTIPAGAIPDEDLYIEVNITASLNVNITNNRDFNDSFQDDTTDAVLVINENNCGAPTDRGGRMDALGETTSGFEAGCSPPDSDFQDPQFGVLVTNNRLEWTGVQVPIPGAVDFPEWTTIRLTSMRGNASMLGVPDEGAPAFAQIQATVTVNGESSITLNTNEANIGLPLLGLISNVDDEIASGLQCEDEGGHATLTLNEGFPTAFKTIGTASFTISGSVQVENGYPAPGSGATTAPGDGGATAGGATQSTHFLLTFHNIPEGVRVGVEDDPDCTEDDLDSDHLMLDAVECDVNGDDCGSAAAIDDADDPLNETVEVDIDGGSGWIGYEVVDDWTIASEDCDIEIWFAWTPDTENDLPAPGTGQLSVSFAPLSTVGTSTENEEPRPRFLDGSGSDPENVVNVVRCTSTILFPFVTNQNNFDTGLVISNTSEDWLGTSPQDGACEIHYHGETAGGGAAPPIDPSTVILAGDQLVWLLSSGNAAMDIDQAVEFQGYVIAVCDFQYGHGYAFISDGFGAIPKLAQGYLALILDVDEESVRALTDGVEALDQ